MVKIIPNARNQFLMSWGKWFFVAGAGFRESDTFASQLHRDLQFQGRVLGCWTALLHWELYCRLFAQKFAFARSLVEILVLEVWIVTFGESLVENARFGSLDSHFWWKSRGKCSFWKLGFSFLVIVSGEMLVLEAWIVTFGESLVVSSKSVKQECPDKSVKHERAARVSSKRKSVKQECPAKASSKSVQQEGQARVSRKSVKKECIGKSVKKKCQARVSSESVKQECPARVSSKECQKRVSSKSVQQECPVKSVQQESLAKSVQQECPARVPSKSVKKECLGKSVKRECPFKSVPQECQTRMSSKSVKQERPARVSSKIVRQECPARLSSKSVLSRASSKSVLSGVSSSVEKESVAKSVKQECPFKSVLHPVNSVQDGCLTRVSSKSVLTRPPSKSAHKSVQKLPSKSVKKECPLKSVWQERQARVSDKSVGEEWQECPAWSFQDIQQECRARVSSKCFGSQCPKSGFFQFESVKKSVKQECPRMSHKSVLQGVSHKSSQTWQHSGSWVLSDFFQLTIGRFVAEKAEAEETARHCLDLSSWASLVFISKLNCGVWRSLVGPSARNCDCFSGLEASVGVLICTIFFQLLQAKHCRNLGAESFDSKRGWKKWSVKRNRGSIGLKILSQLWTVQRILQPGLQLRGRQIWTRRDHQQRTIANQDSRTMHYAWRTAIRLLTTKTYGILWLTTWKCTALRDRKGFGVGERPWVANLLLVSLDAFHSKFLSPIMLDSFTSCKVAG